MSPGLIKMWIALSAIGLMFVSVLSISLSRAKMKGFLKYIVAIFAYACMVVAGILIVFVVFSGPVQK
jgi:Kef-type K+ transport system membrane component KefB